MINLSYAAVWLAGVLTGFGLGAAVGLDEAPAAHADPGCGFHDPMLCNPGKVYYCPDTGHMITWLQYCPSLTQGPYLPGGRTPDGGLGGNDEGEE